MSEELWTAVDKYLTDLFVPQDAALEAVLADSDAAGLPTIAVSANEGKLLHLLARAVGARKILEVGTLGGYSTIWLARALPVGGRLISLEYAEKNAEVARKNIARAGLADRVEVRVGRAVDTLPESVGEAPFDLIFIDADKESYAEYLDWAVRLGRSGTVIIADNVVRDGAVLDAASEDSMVKGIQRFNLALAAEKRVDATAIQTVGSKGWDGFALALVK